MMLEILAGATLRLCLLALLVELGLRLFCIRHAQLQFSAWTAVLVASLAMPMLQRYTVVTVPVPIHYVPATNLSAAVASARAIPAVTGPAVTASVAPGVTAPVQYRQPAWRFWLIAGYLAVAGTLLLRMIIGIALSWRLLHAARPVTDSWAEGARVRASAAITAPVTIGRSIVMPADCGDWCATTRRAVLAHERAHAAGGDFYVLLLAQLNRALFWFNPVTWWLHYQLAKLAEVASDDAAINALDDAPGYAEILLDMSRRSGPAFGGVAMARLATLRQRIERILTQTDRPSPAGPWHRAAYAAAVVPLALATAMAAAGAAPPDKAMLDAQREPHTAIKIDPKLLDAYAGYYRNAKTGSLMIVTRDGDHLLTRRAGNPPVPEYPYTDHDFFLTIVAQQNTFVTDASGAAVRVIHHALGQTETLDRLSDADGRRELAAFMQRLQDERAIHVEVPIDPQLLDKYVGAYQLNPRMIFTVTRDGNKLFARLTGQQAYELHPYSDHDFFYTVVAAQLTFVTGDSGNASAVILHQKGLDRTAERVDPALAQTLDRKISEEREPHTPIAIDPHFIDQYVGRYLNDKIEMTISREGSQMFAQVTGYGRYPIYPYTDHDFFATIIPAQISFVTDHSGKATQLIRHQFGNDAILNRVE
jgi:beta-lactamase regulating signal transducer with metallopeptidase domain